MTLILKEKNTNFDSLIKNLENYPDLSRMVAEIVLEGTEKGYNRDNLLINMGEMYGIFREEREKVRIHNRIYEQRIYNYLSSKVETAVDMGAYNFRNHSQFI